MERIKKRKRIGELIGKCMHFEKEMARMITIGIAYCSPSEVRKKMGIEIPSDKRSELKEEGDRLGGFNKVIKKRSSISEEYDNCLLQMARLLEEDGFDVKRFERDLNDSQYSWLRSRAGEIRKHLKPAVRKHSKSKKD
jgi:hypothetical protein